MSAVAGRMATQVGAACLEKERGGKGILLGGVPGTRRGKVAIIGGGVVGQNAARIAVGLGAQVTVLDINQETLTYLDDVYQGRLHTLYSDPHSSETSVKEADLVFGAVLVTGARAPRLVTEAMVAKMEPGSVIVDVAVDQGGCIATTHDTTHADPVYERHGVLHYAVGNMPGAVPFTSTYALTNSTLPYVLQVATQGVAAAAAADPGLALGVNTACGHVTHPIVAGALDRAATPLGEALAA
jgi:alanine dehydrogenase